MRRDLGPSDPSTRRERIRTFYRYRWTAAATRDELLAHPQGIYPFQPFWRLAIPAEWELTRDFFRWIRYVVRYGGRWIVAVYKIVGDRREALRTLHVASRREAFDQVGREIRQIQGGRS